jgi:hypothetical protein
VSEYSKGTDLVWKIAAIEAQNLKHQQIDPVDLMLGLLKIVDVEPEGLMRFTKSEEILKIKSEITEIQQIFLSCGIIPSKTRRRLRRESLNHAQNVVYKDGVIHRSELSKRIFSDAVSHLLSNEKNIRPIHLLSALLEKQDPDLDRSLLIVSFPVSSVLHQIVRKETPADGLKHPSLPAVSNQLSGSESLMRHCRAAIGYLELSMFDEAEEELNKIELTEQGHPAVKRLRNDIRDKRP